jgi:3-oxoacyl-[acyl-carrier-protein] synthase-3
MQATIRAITSHLPGRALTNAELAAEFPDWGVEKIARKTGIESRRLAADGQCASDLAVEAARALFAEGACRPEDVDFLLLCTQSPDYFLPTTACLLQDRLGLPTGAGALDFNLGCSGFVYGLGLAKGLVETGQARHVLLITAETYSKYLAHRDRGVRTIFGDGAAATLVQGVDGAGEGGPALGPFAFGTDGRGADKLIVRAGGARRPRPVEPGDDALFMDGSAVFTFTMEAVPDLVEGLLAKAGLAPDDVDLFVFHQANRYMLDNLRDRLGIPPEKFPMALRDCGNTVSATIPIALERARAEGILRPGQRLMLVGFGVGYSWAATMVRWTAPASPGPGARGDGS